MRPHANRPCEKRKHQGETVGSIAERCRKARLGWFGHVKRRDEAYVGRQTLEMVPPGIRNRGRPKQRWVDCVTRDMIAIGTTNDEVHDRIGWRRIVSAAATPQPSGRGLKNNKPLRDLWGLRKTSLRNFSNSVYPALPVSFGAGPFHRIH